tara:strand:+ start:352 stop:1119 length:768 start_codon:yes stop_codon:yes gene_type:complete
MAEVHYLQDCPSMTLPNGWTIQGFSVAAHKTGFLLPHLRLCFDAGLPSKKHVDAVCLTHSHGDHSFQIMNLVNRNASKPTTVYCPQDTHKHLQHFMDAAQSLNDNQQIQVDHSNIVSLQDNQRIPFKDIEIQTIPCCHTVPCLGYILYKRKRKRREDGQYDRLMVPQMAFLGDTTVEVFSNRLLDDVPVIFVECTVIDSALTREETRKRGHMHWDDLKPITLTRANTLFVLIHPSKRYKKEQWLSLESHNVKCWV